MDSIKNQVIAALQSNDIEEVKRLQPELRWEAAANKWLDSHIINGKGNIPISKWIHDNPFIMFGSKNK